MSEKKSVLKRQLKNSKSPILSINGLQLCNANGDVDPTSAGYQYLIDTLSEIRSDVVKQKFYKVAPADYFPVDVGEAAWADEIVQNLQFSLGGDFFQGDVDTLAGNGRISSVNTAMSPVRMPVKTWAKQAQWTIMEIEMAARASKWDVVASRMEALKENWDLGIQEVGFLGHPSISAMTGLLNDGEVNINTTLIPVPISDMSETQFAALVRGLLAAYNANSNGTAYPDTFVIPTSDYLGLADPVSNTYPNISKLEYLTNALKKMTANEGFKILPLTYAEDSRNAIRGINKNRYVLYNTSDKTMSMSIPVDFNLLQPGTSNNLMWENPAYGQYSGLLINRKREVLYLDETAVAT